MSCENCEESAYVIDKLAKLLAEIAVIVNGPEPPLTRWSYHDLPEKVRGALKQAPPAALAENVAADAYAHACERMEEWQRKRARIAELEAVLVKFDERWLMDGELGFCVACGVSIEGGDAHKPECWLTEARAALDAAREAKP